METTSTLTRIDWLEPLRERLVDVDGESTREGNTRRGARFIGVILALGTRDSTEDLVIADLVDVARRYGLTLGEVRWGAGMLTQLGWLARVDTDRYRMTIPALPRSASAPLPAGGRRCALYRWRDEQRTLLYVGITYDVTTRDAGHAAKSPWWCFAHRQSVEWFPDRATAEAAEREAIRSEAPLFNRRHNDTPAAKRRIGEYLGAHKRMDLFYDAMTAA